MRLVVMLVGYVLDLIYMGVNLFVDRSDQVEERVRHALTTAASSRKGELAWVKRVEIEVGKPLINPNPLAVAINI